MAAKLKAIKAQLQRRMHARIPGTVLWLQQVVRGYFQYHAVPGNCERLDAFRTEVVRLWYRALHRRSQRSRLRWATFGERLAILLPTAQILHSYPNLRFDAKYPSIRGKNRVR